MTSAINWLIVSIVNGMLRIFRMPGLNRSNIYAALGLPVLQPWLESMSRRKALDIYVRARSKCPAYKAFLKGQSAPRITSPSDVRSIPETTKANYVRIYSIEDRCYGGRIPRRGVVIDESSGSSGTPNNWVRGPTERSSVRRLLQHGFELAFPSHPDIVLNCFALGPWATGMNVSMSLIDIAIMKSIGPDKQKLEHTLKVFGSRYRYLLAGYPPFIKDFIDTTTVGLAEFEMHLIVGGEGISEGLRDCFRGVFRTVHSSYGASDLEINIAADTDFSIALRRLALATPALSRDLFGRDDPPMVFQYNPMEYFIERTKDGELVFTLLRRGNVSPKVRYNIHDLGGTIRHRDLPAILARHGLSMADLPSRHSAFPLLYVFGRSDLTVPFYGAKVFTTDIEAILNGDAELRDAFHSFQMKTSHDADLNEILTITLERTEGAATSLDNNSVRQLFFDGLKRVNQDFREVSRMFTEEKLIIEQCDHGTGPFAQRDIRVKNQYIA